MQEMLARSLAREDPLEKDMATRLQYPCLGNAMDRGAWRATAHGDSENWTWLSDWAHRTGKTSSQTCASLSQEECERSWETQYSHQVALGFTWTGWLGQCRWWAAYRWAASREGTGSRAGGGVREGWHMHIWRLQAAHITKRGRVVGTCAKVGRM